MLTPCGTFGRLLAHSLRASRVGIASMPGPVEGATEARQSALAPDCQTIMRQVADRSKSSSRAAVPGVWSLEPGVEQLPDADAVLGVEPEAVAGLGREDGVELVEVARDVGAEL